MVPYFLKRLELDETADERAVRRAYARELKKIDQENDLEGFQALRAAYDAALHWVKLPKAIADDEETGEEEPVQSPDHVSVSYAVPTVVPQFRADEIQPVRAPKDEALESATIMFAQYMEAFVSEAAVSALLVPKDWEAKLEQALNGDGLVNIASRDIFEYKFAELLARGWRPGHETLFVVAAKVFHWDEDCRHLRRMGQVGYVIERALHERAMYDRLSPEDRLPQRALIQRLRNSTEPTESELKASLSKLEKLVGNFPTWLAVITNIDNLATWRKSGESLTLNKGKAFNVAEGAPKPQKKPFMAPWFVMVLVLMAISTLANMTNSPMPQPPVRISPEVAEILAKSRAKSDTTSPNNPNGTSPHAGRPAPPPLSKSTIATLVKKPTTNEVCTEVAKIAYDYGVGTSLQDADPGPAFDRKVVDCVVKNYWPRPIAGDPAILQSANREKLRAEAELKKFASKYVSKSYSAPTPPAEQTPNVNSPTGTSSYLQKSLTEPVPNFQLKFPPTPDNSTTTLKLPNQ